MAEHLEKLKRAIERLPLQQKVDVDDLASALELGTYFARINQLPRMQSSRQKNGMQKELREFAKIATRLHRLIGEMHREAIGAVSPQGKRHILSVQDDLAMRIKCAINAADNAPETPARPSNRRLAPKQVAEVCAQFFEDLTGKRPTLAFDAIDGERSGPYLRFVQDTFDALGIDASAEHYARQAQNVGDTIGGEGGVTIRRIPPQK